jgi:hypothetical protein
MFLFKPTLKTKISLFTPPPPPPRLSEKCACPSCSNIKFCHRCLSVFTLPVAIFNLATAVKVFVRFLWQYLKLVTAALSSVCALPVAILNLVTAVKCQLPSPPPLPHILVHRGNVNKALRHQSGSTPAPTPPPPT